MHQEILNPRKLLLSRVLNIIPDLVASRQPGNRKIIPEEIQKIIVLDYQCIGDVIMIQPALESLRKYFKEAEIILLVAPAVGEIARKSDFAHRVIDFPNDKIAIKRLLCELRNEKIDLSLNFHGDVRQLRLMNRIAAKKRAGFLFSGGKRFLTHACFYPFYAHQVERPFYLLEHLGINTDVTSPVISVPEKDEEFSGYILLHPGANHPARRWPEERWDELANRLKNKYRLLWIMPPGEEHKPVNIRSERMSLSRFAAILPAARLLICCDSMAGHMAAASGVPALAVFGTQNPKLTKPFGELGYVINPSEECTHSCRNWRLCEKCIAGIQTEQVISEVEKILS